MTILIFICPWPTNHGMQTLSTENSPINCNFHEQGYNKIVVCTRKIASRLQWIPPQETIKNNITPLTHKFQIGFSFFPYKREEESQFSHPHNHYLWNPKFHSQFHTKQAENYTKNSNKNTPFSPKTNREYTKNSVPSIRSCI